jgi:hypothetical protein
VRQVYSRLVDAISLKFMGTAFLALRSVLAVVGCCCWMLFFVVVGVASCGGLVGGDVRFASIDTFNRLCLLQVIFWVQIQGNVLNAWCGYKK